MKLAHSDIPHVDGKPVGTYRVDVGSPDCTIIDAVSAKRRLEAGAQAIEPADCATWDAIVGWLVKHNQPIRGQVLETVYGPRFHPEWYDKDGKKAARMEEPAVVDPVRSEDFDEDSSSWEVSEDPEDYEEGEVDPEDELEDEVEELLDDGSEDDDEG